MPELVRFKTNVPEVLCLAYDDGKPVQGQYGDQFYYTLADGRATYVEPIVEKMRRQLGIGKEEPFSVCRREVRDGTRKMIRWEVERIATDEPEAATTSPAPAASAHQRSYEQPQATTLAVAPAVRSATKLEDALKTVVAAIHATRTYAKEIGFEMPVFSAEDLRTMANTLMIQNGGGR